LKVFRKYRCHPVYQYKIKWLIDFLHGLGARHMLFRYLLFGVARHVNFANENSDRSRIYSKILFVYFVAL
jgi:hypothetical protein